MVTATVPRTGVRASLSPASQVAVAWDALAGVVDPEIPIVSIVELGIVRGVRVVDATVVVDVTPTYSGCPATEAIAAAIRDALSDAGIDRSRVDVALAPSWTTDWIAPEAKRRLRAFGIAPPHRANSAVLQFVPRRRAVSTVSCPRCGSTHTRIVSAFGSTACKAQYRCDDCLEPFDYFKPL